MTGTVVVDAPPRPTPDAHPAPARPPTRRDARRDPDAAARAEATAGAHGRARRSRRPEASSSPHQQAGTRVRGSVDVAQPASRLEVTVMAGKTKVGTLR